MIERRGAIHPSDVSGKYRRRRSWVSAALVVVFLILPWIQINGHQSLLLDFRHGKFAVFGLSFWAHDAPMFLFVFGGAAVLLAFVTSVWGRLWCGWACPQTVFVDSVFRRVERWLEGDGFRRRQLDRRPWDTDKVLRRGLKWGVFTVLAVVLSHSFLAYFIGVEALGEMVRHSPLENSGSFMAMAGISLFVLFDFGWFREQFCTQLCPYGRFQSVLMDERSLAVAYDKTRTDCVQCNRCVLVCPTGIDIRHGLQMECVACTACIDACDTVMLKVKKPLGLIRYMSGRNLRQVVAGRPLAYLAILVGLLVGLSVTLARRQPVEVAVIRSIGQPYHEIARSDGSKDVVNHFKLDILNQTFGSVTVALSESKSLGARIVSPGLPLQLEAGQSRRVDVFVEVPLSVFQEGHAHVEIGTVASSVSWREAVHQSQEVPLVGPLR